MDVLNRMCANKDELACMQSYKQKDDVKCKHSNSNSVIAQNAQTERHVQVQLQSDVLTAKGRVELQM